MSSPIREVLVDIDTTGRQVLTGGRIKRMVCLELIDRVPTGAVFTQDEGDEFAMHELIAFLNHAVLVCHDAVLVRRYLDTEFERADPCELFFHRYNYIDGESLAMRAFGGWDNNLYPLEKYLSLEVGDRYDKNIKSRAMRFAKIYATLMLQPERKPIVFDTDEAWINHIGQFLVGKDINGHINFYDEPQNPLEGIKSPRVGFYSYQSVLVEFKEINERSWFNSHFSTTFEELADYKMMQLNLKRCNAIIRFINSKISIEWIKREKDQLFLDDVREAPKGWTRVYWPKEAITLLKTGQVKEISLDHDLGNDARGTGYDVIKWIEEAVVTKGFKPPIIHVHSANSAARARMEAGIKSIYEKAKNG
jgi:hypothetical protein